MAVPVPLAESLDEIGRGLCAAVLSDSLDRVGLRNQVMDASVRPVLPTTSCVGFAATLLFGRTDTVTDEPYTGQIAAADSLRDGEVAVLASSGITDCAVWGELFSNAALGRRARGIVTDGYHRDTVKITEVGVPVFSCGSRPIDVAGRAEVVAWGVPVVCGGVHIEPRDIVFADVDGVVVIPSGVATEVLELAFEKVGREDTARDELRGGALIADVWRRHRVL